MEETWWANGIEVRLISGTRYYPKADRLLNGSEHVKIYLGDDLIAVFSSADVIAVGDPLPDQGQRGSA